MKKILLILVMILGLVACDKIDPLIKLEEFVEGITISEEIEANIKLPEFYNFDGEELIAIWTSSKPNIISHEGHVVRGIYDEEVNLHLFISSVKGDFEREFTVTVLGYGIEKLLSDVLDTIVLPETTKYDITLPLSITYLSSRKITITWESSKPQVINSKGQVTEQEEDVLVTLTAYASFESIMASKEFQIKIKGLSDQEKLNTVFLEATPPSHISSDIILMTDFRFNINGTWTSSHPEILSNTGKIGKNIVGPITVSLTLSLNTNDWRTYEVIVTKTNHIIIDQAFLGRKENVKIDNQDLILEDDALVGTYISGTINTLDFTSAVASWAAISSKKATVELEIQFLVGSTWSKFFSYGAWGLGLENKSYNSSDSLAKMTDDIIDILNNKKASAINFKMTLKRTSLEDETPRLRLIAATLDIPGYSFPVNVSNLPTSFDHDVPKLYQHVVPTIGNSICSPTSATMLLKYKGHSFKNIPGYVYEHEYIAKMAKEYRSGIFGNWTYNTVTISALGEISYVARMYSAEELVYHLATVGPVSASIKGRFIGELGGNYNTNGHLIVVRGYEYVGGQLYFIVNDPNIAHIYDKVKVENFMTVWRNIVYVVK